MLLFERFRILIDSTKFQNRAVYSRAVSKSGTRVRISQMIRYLLNIQEWSKLDCVRQYFKNNHFNFFCLFYTFFSHFGSEKEKKVKKKHFFSFSAWKHWQKFKMNKKGWKQSKKYFNKLSGAKYTTVNQQSFYKIFKNLQHKMILKDSLKRIC